MMTRSTLQQGPGPASRDAEHVRTLRQDVARRYSGGADPGLLLSWFAEEHDRIIARLFAAVELPPEAQLVSLVALGGYGRGELYPYSDIDLLLLVQEGAVACWDGLVEQVIYPLWDARVSVGHAVRTIGATLELAREDLTMRTALLDARLVAGDEGPYHALKAGALREFFGPQKVSAFVDALREERRRRHRRFGVTEYLLEPNVKNSKGGLRDLNAGLWAAKARFDAEEIEELATHGVASARQIATLVDARRYLRELRLVMHLEAGRAQDHLRFDLQEKLGPRLFPEIELPGLKRSASAVAPAVERLMHAFYRHARAVVIETDGILERCSVVVEEAPPTGQPVSERADEHLELTERHVRSSEPRRFWDAPAEMIRAFQAVLEHRRPLDRRTRDAIAEAAAGEAGAQLPADEQAALRWMELLCSAEGPGEGTVLEEMHHLGVIAAMIPEFEPCTGRIQHDLFHVYTVDLHSLYVVALLKAWRRGESGSRFETAVSVMARLAEPDSLMLAALLHDVGKPLGAGHAAKGARLAAGVAARLGLSPRQQADVRFLVEQHLLMAHLSQRRDLSDPGVIAGFCRRVESVDRLRRLYLLTVADSAMTAPGNLSEWKASLLDELYLKAYAHLSQDAAGASLRLEAELTARRDALELGLRRRFGPEAAELMGRLPDELVLSYEAEELLQHLGVAMDLERTPGALLRLSVRRRGPATTELTICCADSPGRLALITGVLLAHRVEVLGAQVYTLGGAGGEPGPATVLDVFTVSADAARGESLWDAVRVDLEAGLGGTLSVRELVARHTRRSALGRRITPHVQTVVAIDNGASERFTVIDVQAPDRLGVLHAITRTLSELGLEIHLSRVASEAGRVVDNFYVSDEESGAKVVDGDRLDRVRDRVTHAIEELR